MIWCAPCRKGSKRSSSQACLTGRVYMNEHWAAFQEYTGRPSGCSPCCLISSPFFLSSFLQPLLPPSSISLGKLPTGPFGIPHPLFSTPMCAEERKPAAECSITVLINSSPFLLTIYQNIPARWFMPRLIRRVSSSPRQHMWSGFSTSLLISSFQHCYHHISKEPKNHSYQCPV